MKNVGGKRKSRPTRENVSSFFKSPSRFLAISWSDTLVSAIEDCNETKLIRESLAFQD